MERHLFDVVNHFAQGGDEASMRHIIADMLTERYNNLTPEEVELVVSYLNALAKEGDHQALLTLGSLYYSGFYDLPQDYNIAMSYYERAAETSELRDSWALNNLGYCYYYGKAGAIDYKKAYECYAYAAIQGNANSMYKLGDMYYNGQHVQEDVEAAFFWYTLANEQELDADPDYRGYLSASIAFRLGRAYLYGEGTEADPVHALFELRTAEFLFYRQIINGDEYSVDQLPLVQELIKAATEELDSQIK